jgi:arsenite methyltransferase
MVMSGIGFDEQVSRQVEKLYLTPDVAAQRCEVLKLLELRQGERVLDIGSGPGLLAYEMAVAVGPEGRVWCHRY